MNSEQDSQTKKARWLVPSLVFWVAAFGSILLSLSRFKQVYAVHAPGEPLPLVCRVPMALYAVAMVAGLVLLPWMQHAIPDASSCRKTNIAVGLLSILLFILYVVDVFLPLTRLVDKLGA